MGTYNQGKADLAVAQTWTAAQTFGSGLLKGNDVAFPAVQVASTDANTLDDYEEGTFDPTITSVGGGAAAAYTAQDGAYVKIGQLVVVSFDVTLNGKGTLGAGQAQVGALPFSRLVTDGNYPGLALAYFSGMTTSVVFIFGNVSGTVIGMQMLTAAATGASDMNISDISTAVRLAGTVSYRATA